MSALQETLLITHIEAFFIPRLFITSPKSQTEKGQELLVQLLPKKIFSQLPDRTYLNELSYTQLYDLLIQVDPENGKNCRWVFNQFKNKQFRLEDISRVRMDLELFFVNNNKLPEKEKKLGSIDYTRLKELIEPFESKEEIEFIPIESEHYIVLYNGPYGRLYQLLTEKGACEIGRGTKWCTAGKKDNRFEEYNKEGEIYVWDDNQSKKKYQIQIETGQFMGERDDEISVKLQDYYLNNHPIVSQFLLNKVKKLIEMNVDINKWFIMLIVRWPALEKYIKSNSKSAYYYAKYVIEDKWEEAEEYIKKDPKSAYKYARDMIRGRWKKAEEYIMTDPQSAYLYTSNKTKRRWVKAEPYIMTDPHWAFYYALEILGKRWPEAEPYIIKDSKSAYEYARHIIKGRWTEAEPYIIKDSKSTYEYARHIIKGRWP